MEQAELEKGRRTVSFDKCAVAFFNASFSFRAKGKHTHVLRNATAAFTAGQNITILGHEQSGKSTVLDIMAHRRALTGGRLGLNRELSWPMPYSAYLDMNLSPRQNCGFLSRVMQVPKQMLIDGMSDFVGLEHRQLDVALNQLPLWVKKRSSLFVLITADFDVHLFDGPIHYQQYALAEKDQEALEGFITSRPYIQTTSNPRRIRDDTDLVYILYEGQFFMFEDIEIAKAGFAALPQPQKG